MTDGLESLRRALGERYEIERQIGAGGMATVYLARDLKHDRPVALKVLKPEVAATLGPDRFPREIKIVAQLSHPHILPLHDSGEAGGFLYFVMPYVEGESLRTKLKREGELPIREALRILTEVVDALAYAHQHGVVHRDIKPDNVLLTGRHALVADFGVAKAISSSATSVDTLTTAGVALGTPTYMAPEQATGQQHVDHRADIYAVGALAYEMLAGKPPFDGENAQQVLAAHVIETPEPLTKWREAVSPMLNTAVMKCLEKRPADRWQSAEELLPLLEQATTPSAGVTPTDTRPVKVGPIKTLGRRRWMVGTAGALLLAFVGLGGWFMRGAFGGEFQVRRVAVLPLHNLSGESTEQFVDGMHDALVTGLARLNVFTVSSRTSVLRYKHTDKTVREIGTELGVDAILEGTVLRVGNQVRINAQLVNANNDQHIWAQSFEREFTDPLTVQREVVEAVAREIEAAVVEGRAVRAAQAVPLDALQYANVKLSLDLRNPS